MPSDVKAEPHDDAPTAPRKEQKEPRPKKKRRLDSDAPRKPGCKKASPGRHDEHVAPPVTVPPAELAAEFRTNRAVLLKQLAELCKACDVDVVPMGFSEAGIDIGATVPEQRTQLCVRIAADAFSAMALVEQAEPGDPRKVVVGVDADELLGACKQTIRAGDDAVTLQVHADLASVSLVAGFDPRHRRRMRIRSSPAQVVRVSMDEERFAGVRPITILSASLTRALKPIRGAATTRVRIVGRTSRWVAMFFENGTTETSDVFLAEDVLEPPSDEEVHGDGDFSYTLMAAHIGKLLRVVGLGRTVRVWVAPGLPVRFGAVVGDAHGTADLLMLLQPSVPAPE